MAEGTTSEDSSEKSVDVQGQVSCSPPTSDLPVPKMPTSAVVTEFKCVNNNKEHVNSEVIITLPIQAHVNGTNVNKLEQLRTTVTESAVLAAAASAAAVVVQQLPLSGTDDATDSASGTDNSTNSNRRHSKSSSLPHGVKLCPETLGPGNNCTADSDGLVSGAEEKWANLEAELRKAHEDLQAKDDEVEKLKGIRQLVEDELHDLTSSLFQEAHKMVSEAKMKEIASEKHLKETKMQMDGLQAEVAALKALLITSTPSKPNLGNNGKTGISTMFKKQHTRTPSHNHLVYGRSDETDGTKLNNGDGRFDGGDREHGEVDPELHSLFQSWRENPTLNKSRSDFLKRIYDEDIEPCIRFQNQDLVKRLMVAIEENSIWVDPLPEKSKTNVPRECALLRLPRVCHYQMRFAFSSEEAFDISQLCRDRVATVCEFLNYLRYIKNGLVKASVDDSYWEIIRLRKQMALAKLGLSISS